MEVADLVVVGVLVFVAVRLAGAVRVSLAARDHVFQIVRGVRTSHVLLALPALAVVLTLAVALLSVPGLDVGWWSALGGEGNPVFGMTSERDDLLRGVVVPVVFLVMLVVAMPLLVATEERIFRRGAEQRGPVANAGRAVLFGLAHALVGIPVGAALALSAGGAYLTLWYLHGWRRTGTQQGALLEASRAHLAYNGVIVAVVAVALLAGW